MKMDHEHPHHIWQRAACGLLEISCMQTVLDDDQRQRHHHYAVNILIHLDTTYRNRIKSFSRYRTRWTLNARAHHTIRADVSSEQVKKD